MNSIRFVEIRTASLAPEWIASDIHVRRKSHNYRKDARETFVEVQYLPMIRSVYENYIQYDMKRAMRRENEFQDIEKLFREAVDNNDVQKIIRAYTLNGSFFKILNHHLAIILCADHVERIKMRKKVNMRYWQGSLDIATILLCHPGLEEFRFRQGTVYRGMRYERDEDLLPYQSRSIPILNKTFVSTSKDRAVAMAFTGVDSGSSSPVKSCLFKYTIVESARRTALDIHRLSQMPEEEEVLILPYASFLVTNYQRSLSNENLIEIELRECDD